MVTHWFAALARVGGAARAGSRGVLFASCATALLFLFQAGPAASAQVDFSGNGMADVLLVAGEQGSAERLLYTYTGSAFRLACGAEADNFCGLANGEHWQHPLTRIFAEDFDGDGRTDLLVISGDPERLEREFFLSNGDGFDRVCAEPGEGGCGFESAYYMQDSRTRMLPGDYTGDGKTDLLMLSGDPEQPRRQLLSAQGARFVDACAEGDCGLGDAAGLLHPRSRVLTGDFSGDGRSEMLLLSGDPGFPQRALYAWGGSALQMLCEEGEGPSCGLPTHSSFTHPDSKHYAADFTGNGKSDLLVFSGDPAAPGHVLYGSTGAAFEELCRDCVFSGQDFGDIGPDEHILHPNSRLLVADFDGSGKADVLLVSGVEQDPRRVLSLSQGQGFATACAGNSGAACGLSVSAFMTDPRARFLVEDFDGDGRGDLLLLSAGEQILFRAQAGGGFSAACGDSYSDGCGIAGDALLHHRTRYLPADEGSPPLVLLAGSRYNDTNATHGLRAALASSAAEVYLDGPPGRRYFTAPLSVNSNQIVQLQRGVVLEAMEGSFVNPRDVLLGVFDKENVTIRGEPGATLRMRKGDYSEGEWRHAVSIRGSKNVTVSDLIIESSGGDGVYVGGSVLPLLRYSKNVYLQRLTLDDHGRNGISVISACNLLVEDNLVKNTVGTQLLAANGPWAGIDIEPNLPSEILKNIVVRNNRFESNQNYGVLMYLRNLADDRPDHEISIRVEGNHIQDSGNGIKVTLPVIQGGKVQPGGRIDFVDNTVIGTDAAGLFISNKGIAGPLVNVYKLRLEQTARLSTNSGLTRVDANSYLAPIVITKDKISDRDQDDGGIRMEEVHVLGNLKAYVAALENFVLPGGIRHVHGAIIVGDGGSTEVLERGDMGNVLFEVRRAPM